MALKPEKVHSWSTWHGNTGCCRGHDISREGLKELHQARHRHGSRRHHDESRDKVMLVGSPNVGKSVVFNALTGTYATVSNYPGTTVDVMRGRARLGDKVYEVIDTPGFYSLMTITSEEAVTRSLFIEEEPAVVVHVVDGKHLERMLPLTYQLIEAGLPVILDINMMDEAEKSGLRIDVKSLQKELGIPVVATVSPTGRGIPELRNIIREHDNKSLNTHTFNYGADIEENIAEISKLLKKDYVISKRAISLLLLQEDPEIMQAVRENEGSRAFAAVKAAINSAKTAYEEPLSYIISMSRKEAVDRIIAKTVTAGSKSTNKYREFIDNLTMNPVTAVPILLLVLYYGLYKFVGVFGAGTLVDYLERQIFEARINPVVNNIISSYVPWPSIQLLLGFDYGIITLGIRYAVAIILPIVSTFFFTFSIIEDTGYLPRLAMLVDFLFKKIGLSGRAVIPMTLGFGCDTMATMVSRTLETTRERIIATFLLALAIPCSAQLGVILSLLSGNFKALLIWMGFLVLVFILIGYLTAQVLPGQKPAFYMEIPPLRLPKLSNILVKTYTRVYWYLLEVVPVFVIASALIWLGKMTGVFDLMIERLGPLMTWIGLPPETAQVFLFGFFRRDYGAAGLYDLQSSGLLNGGQLVVAAATLTLFVPCIAQFSMMVKERGIRATILMTAFIFPFAFGAGFVLNKLLMILGVVL